MIEKFIKLSEDLCFNDFEVTDDDDLIVSMFGEDKKDQFRVIGQHGSGSLIAVWDVDNKSPIVWIDTEGEASVITSTFEEFLSLLPYYTGFIYDCIFYSKTHSEEELQQNLNKNIENYEDQIIFRKWLKEEFNIEPAKDPVGLIKKSKNLFGNLSDLIIW